MSRKYVGRLVIRYRNYRTKSRVQSSYSLTRPGGVSAAQEHGVGQGASPISLSIHSNVQKSKQVARIQQDGEM